MRSIRPTERNGGWRKMAEPAEVLTTEEAADLLRVSTKTVLALAGKGKLPGRQVGRAWRFLRSDLVRYLHGGEQSPSDAVAS